MEFNAFIAALKSSLVERGIDQNTADRYVTSVSRSFKEDDIKRIATYQKPSDFSSLSDSIANAIKRKMSGNEKPRTTVPQGQKAPVRQQNIPAEAAVRNQANARPAPERPAARRNEPQSLTDRVLAFIKSFSSRPAVSTKPRYNDDNDSAIMEVGENGKKIFWIAAICLSPLLLFLALVYLGFFAVLYVAVSLAIIGCILALIAIVVAGSAIALVGLVYGTIRLFSIPAEGLYEIGLAVIIIGLIMLFGILLYNLALRVLPLLYGQIKRLFVFLTDKLKSLLYYLKRECYKL